MSDILNIIQFPETSQNKHYQTFLNLKSTVFIGNLSASPSVHTATHRYFKYSTLLSNTKLPIKG